MTTMRICQVFGLFFLWVVTTQCSHRDLYGRSDSEKPVMVSQGEKDCFARGVHWQFGADRVCRLRDFLGYCKLDELPDSIAKLVTHLKNEVNASDCEAANAALRQQTSLYLGDYAITDIYPLVGFTQIKILVLGHNAISDISPLADMRGLLVLRLESNQIKNINIISELKSLIILRLDDNQIEDVRPLAGLPRLAQLNLSKNRVKDVSPLSGLYNLRQLGLSSNQVADLSPLGALGQLNLLEVTGNPITCPIPGGLSTPALANICRGLPTKSP